MNLTTSKPLLGRRGGVGQPRAARLNLTPAGDDPAHPDFEAAIGGAPLFQSAVKPEALTRSVITCWSAAGGC